MPDLSVLLTLLQLALKDRTQLALESFALRQPLAVYKRTVTRPKIDDWDRFLLDHGHADAEEVEGGIGLREAGDHYG